MAHGHAYLTPGQCGSSARLKPPTTLRGGSGGPSLLGGLRAGGRGATARLPVVDDVPPLPESVGADWCEYHYGDLDELAALVENLVWWGNGCTLTLDLPTGRHQFVLLPENKSAALDAIAKARGAARG